MKKDRKFVKIMSGVLLLVLLSCSVPMSVSANYNETTYTYYSSDGKDYSNTVWREKDYNGSVNPHGMVCVMCAYGDDSQVSVRQSMSGKNPSVLRNYVTVPYYKRVNIRNKFDKTYNNQVRLRVRTGTNTGYTGGSWSPDSSQSYGYEK